MKNPTFHAPTPESEDFIPEKIELNLNDSHLHSFADENIHEPDIVDSSRNDSSWTTISVYMNEVVEIYRIAIPLLMLACLIAFLSNLLIVCSSRWIRGRRLSPNLMLSLSLAGADAFASLVVGLGLVLNSLLPVALNVQLDANGRCMLFVLEAFRLGSLVSTALHLLALAANHHVGISNPLHYVRIVTRRTILVAAAVIWIAPIVFFVVYFFSVPEDGFNSFECSRIEFILYLPFRATTAVIFFIPLVAMTAIYAHIFTIVRRHQPQNNSSSDRRLKRNVKAAVTTLLILGAYILGWMPAVLYFILTCLDCPVPFKTIPLQVRVPIGLVINALIVGRCLVDPALYLIRMPEVRDALRDMFCVRTLSRNSSNPSSQNTPTDVRRLTLLTSQRKINGYANGRNVITFELKERIL